MIASDLSSRLPAFLLAAVEHTDLWELTPTRFVGRLHPLLLHFPLALVFAAAAVELARADRDFERATATPVLLFFAALTAIPTSVAGWLAAAWEYPGDASVTLDRHRWLGTIATALLVALALVARKAARARAFDSILTAQRLGTFLVTVLLALVGHLGGEVVRGEGYVLKGLVHHVGQRDADGTIVVGRPAAPVAAANASDEERWYFERVRPVFVARCVECHGPSKRKGGFQLVPIRAAFTRPAPQWPIRAGDPDGSDLVRRLLLPRDDDDAMPPKGPGLSREDINAIRQWIRDGAVVPAQETTDDIADRADDGADDARAPR